MYIYIYNIGILYIFNFSLISYIFQVTVVAYAQKVVKIKENVTKKWAILYLSAILKSFC